METKSTITLHHGNLTARQMIPVQSLARTLGANIHPFAGQDPEHVRAELYVVIGDTGDIISNYDTPWRELTGMDLTILAGHIRETLVEQAGGFICKDIRESITPPPPYNDTGCFFAGSKICLTSTGNKGVDKHRADAFNRYLHARNYYNEP